MVSVMVSTPTGDNFICCSNFLKPLDVNSDLKFDIMVKKLDSVHRNEYQPCISLFACIANESLEMRCLKNYVKINVS